MKRCPDCCFGFEDEASLREHVETYHDEETLAAIEDE